MVKQETTLTFYGGVNETGGNKVLLKNKDTKVFFDFGMSFSIRRQFYSPLFLPPKSEKSLQELGILPKLNGVYKSDSKPPEIDALFVPHSHLGHSAYLSFINRDIPMYCGKTTQTILQALGETRRTDLEFCVRDIPFRPFRTGEKLRIGTLEIELVHVDHSVPDAYGFAISTSHGTVVYPGDFRIHGVKPQMTRDLVDKAREAEPVAVVTEATNVTGTSISSEKDVKIKLNSIVGEAGGIVLQSMLTRTLID